ncbi:MAG: YHS domain protein [Ignavibacteriae bacterium]|nr:YHS domain protein [Ignavibacteriota bacterium]
MFGKLFKYLFYLAFFAAIIIVIARFGFSVSYIPLKIHTKYFKQANIVLNGYDVIKYINEKKIQKGLSFYSLKWDEFNWLFSTSGNKKLFKSNPQKYIPQFGGYCGYLVTKNIAYPCDPKIFHVYKGKLYLFSSESKKEAFISDIDNQIAKASLNWNK